MKTKKDVLSDGSDYLISLSKLTGKKIKDVKGYLTCEFDEPVFQMSRIELEDGSYFYCEGEHDMPYLTSGGSDNGAEFDEDELQAIYDEDNQDDTDEEE